MENVIGSAEAVLRNHGYVGDIRPAALSYLSLVSALLPQPVSLVIKGPSGCGKSFALKAGKQFVPAEAYEEFEGMSEKALVYLGDQLNLKHRSLIIQEAAGLSKGVGRVFLRQLLTEGKINYATVQSTAEGLKGEKLPVVEGPCALLMTTTANVLHPEDETRMLSYQMDESPERIGEALLAAAEGRVTEPTEEELAPFHELYSKVRDGNRKAAVPFAGRIVRNLPRSHFRIMRDFPKVLSLIQTLALLHADHRERDESGAVVATLEDYAVVRDLVEDCLAAQLERAAPDHIRKLVEGVDAVLQQKKDKRPLPDEVLGLSVSQREIADFMEIDVSVVSRNVRKAVALGYLVDEEPGQGRTSRISLGERELTSGHVLPLPETLEERAAQPVTA